ELRILVDRALDLPGHDAVTGSADPYVVLEHPAFGRLATSVVLQSRSPVFGARFVTRLQIADLETPLVVSVVDKGFVGKHALIGSARIALRALRACGLVRPITLLTDAGGAPAGSLVIELCNWNIYADIAARFGVTSMTDKRTLFARAPADVTSTTSF